jgi:hypothetical protein
VLWSICGRTASVGGVLLWGLLAVFGVCYCFDMLKLRTFTVRTVVMLLLGVRCE